MSRDDSGSFLPGYAELEIVKKNPFATIDQTGVGLFAARRAQAGESPALPHADRHREGPQDLA